MRSKKKNMKKAFTLIELLVVIAIIALLMSVLVPSLRKAKEAAKLTICANNQKQAMYGLVMYSADNDGVLPPHPADRGNDTVSVINYFKYYRHPGQRGLYHYLGGYLPQIDVFRCPLGRSKDTEELQRQYENYADHFAAGNDGSHTSYNLYFGGYNFKHSSGPPTPMMDGTTFVGPTGKGRTKEAGLVLSDSIYNWSGIPKDWWLAHRPRKGSGQFMDYIWDPRGWGNFCEIFWVYEPGPLPSGGELPVELEELKYNAAYIDGSVRKYSGSEVKWTSNGVFYIPEIWR
jgi:prepilin-type N-terminal cleavage/methylation domain-containing protein